MVEESTRVVKITSTNFLLLSSSVLGFARHRWHTMMRDGTDFFGRCWMANVSVIWTIADMMTQGFLLLGFTWEDCEKVPGAESRIKKFSHWINFMCCLNIFWWLALYSIVLWSSVGSRQNQYCFSFCRIFGTLLCVCHFKAVLVKTILDAFLTSIYAKIRYIERRELFIWW